MIILKNGKTFLAILIFTSLTSCDFFRNLFNRVDEICSQSPIVVTTNEQGGDSLKFCDGSIECYLNNAIATGNFCGKPMQILLKEGERYQFHTNNVENTTPIGVNSSVGHTALPTIKGDITIEGNGAVLERIESINEIFRIFHIESDASLTLRNLTIKNGYATYTGGDTTNRSVAQNKGGAIYCEGKLTIQNCIIENCSSSIFGGGIYATNTSSLFIYNSTFIRNKSYDSDSTWVEGLPIWRPNRKRKGGGAIYTESDTILIEKSVFDQNHSQCGGAISINPMSTIDSIPIQHGQALIKQSVFKNNHADARGGAIYSLRTILNISTYSDSIVVPTVHSRNQEDNLVIENSTFTENHAGEEGGGIFVRTSALYLKHVTLVNNHTKIEHYFDSDIDERDIYKSGGGINIFVSGISLHNCIFANGVGGDLGGSTFTENTHSTNEWFSYSGFNFVRDTTYVRRIPLDETILSGDPMLAPITNAGYRSIYNPLPESPVIDAAPSSECLPVDQLGNTRPIGSGCDLGAVEVR